MMILLIIIIYDNNNDNNNNNNSPHLKESTVAEVTSSPINLVSLTVTESAGQRGNTF